MKYYSNSENEYKLYLPLAVRSSKNVSRGDMRCWDGKAEVTPRYKKVNNINQLQLSITLNLSA